MQYFLGFLLGYAVGSFPTAYLLVQKKARLDIRNAGTGNVGGMNAYDVTRSAPLAALVIGIDIAKGIGAVLLAGVLIGNAYELLGTAGTGAIVGHVFPVWLGFRGGRGLATAAGVMLVLGWVFVLAWVTAWLVSYALSRRLHLANIIAIVSSPLLVLLMPAMFARLLPAGDPYGSFLALTIIVSIILLLGHRTPVLEIIRSHH